MPLSLKKQKHLNSMSGYKFEIVSCSWSFQIKNKNKTKHKSIHWLYFKLKMKTFKPKFR